MALSRLRARRRTSRGALVATLLAVVWCAATALAVVPPQTQWSASADRTDVRRGEVVTVRVKTKIDPEWHLYSMTTPAGGAKPTAFTTEPSTAVTPAGPALQPKPKNVFDDNFGVDTELYEKEVEFAVPFTVADAAPDGPVTIKGSVNFQVCDATRCFPGKYDFEATVTVAAGAARPELTKPVANGLMPGTAVAVVAPKAASSASAPPAATVDAAPAASTTQGDASQVAKARSEGLLAYLWLSIYVGFLSLLTPCVFPMVPITVSYFTKQDGKTRARGLADAAIYSLSIVVTFTLLGLVTSALFGATGIRDFAANPWVNVLLAAIFVGLALNLFGFYEIMVPGSVLTPLSRISSKGGVAGTLLMGVTFTLTSFTCTVPFVGALLVSTAQGDWKWPLVGMLGYSTAFAIPFFFLALFPRLLSSLPKAGGWMVSVKVVMGFLELAAALKFVSNVDLVLGTQKLTREAFLSIWVAIAVVTALYLLGKVRLPHERAVESIGVLRLLFGTAFVALAFYLFTGLQGTSLGELEAFLPPISSAPTATARAGGSGGGGELVWAKDYEAAVAEARKSGKPVFIDFTGYACTNCRWMEKNIFPVPEVRTALDKFELVQLYTDGQGEQYDRNRDLQESRFKTVALPLYVVVDPSGEREIGRVEGLTRDPAEFARFLERSLQGAPAGGDRTQARLTPAE